MSRSMLTVRDRPPLVVPSTRRHLHRPRQHRPGRSVQVEVDDKGGRWTPAASDPDRYHGLDIVRTLADDWGITGDHIARTIWVRFTWPGRA